jgi:hypothetical protein
MNSNQLYSQINNYMANAKDYLEQSLTPMSEWDKLKQKISNTIGRLTVLLPGIDDERDCQMVAGDIVVLKHMYRSNMKHPQFATYTRQIVDTAFWFRPDCTEIGDEMLRIAEEYKRLYERNLLEEG